MAMVYDRNDPTYIYIYMVERRLVIIIVSTSVRHGRRDVVVETWTGTVYPSF